MQDIYFTITGMDHYYGSNIFEPGTKVKLVKDPDNKHDREAIKVVLPGLDKIGYVANSVYTVLGESYSAGRLYDKIADEVWGTVLYKLDRGIVCTLDSESVKKEEIIYQENLNLTKTIKTSHISLTCLSSKNKKLPRPVTSSAKYFILSAFAGSLDILSPKKSAL